MQQLLPNIHSVLQDVTFFYILNALQDTVVGRVLAHL